MFKNIILFLSLILTTVSSQALTDFNSLYFGGTYGRTTPFSGTSFRDDVAGDQSFGLYVGHKYSDKLSAELGYDKNSFDDVKFDAEFIHVGGAYRPASQEFVTPVLRVALGFNQNKIDNAKDESGLGLKLGGGLEFHFPFFTFTALADWRYLDKVSSSLKESQALVATIGVIWPPIKATTASSSKNEPAKAKTQKIDTDKDGVEDSKDKCPNTKANVVVNAIGCAQTETAVFKINVEFASGKTNLQDQYLSEVQELAELMKANPKANVEIAGHTDNTGSEKVNMTLSAARAKSVADALTQKYGVDSSRIKSNGYGSSQPVADNATAEGRKTNRRVDAKISFQQEVKK